MVERRVCTFCGGEIEPGTGRMYIKKDGVVFNFCTSKCFKNMIELGRIPRRTTWTRHYEREKQIRLKGAPEAALKPKARKLRAKAMKVTEAEQMAGPEVEEKEEVGEREAEEKKAEPEKPKARPGKKDGERKALKKEPGEKKERLKPKAGPTEGAGD